MRPLALWRYEAGRAGWTAVLAPVAGLAAPVALSALNGTLSPRVLVFGPEALLPLGVAFVAVTIVARDPVTELQLTLPTRFRTTLLRRLALLIVGSALVAGLFCVALIATDHWAGPSHWALAQSPLVWAGPLLVLPGLAVLIGVATRSVALASSVVGGLWLFQQLYVSPFADHARWLYLPQTARLGVGPGWAADKLVLLLVASALAVLTGWLLGRPERLLTEEEA